VKRRKNTVLATVELLNEAGLKRSSWIRCFLYVCENEGLNVTELALLTDQNVASAARTARMMLGADAPEGQAPFLGLVRLEASQTDNRVRHLYLTEAGRELRDRCDALIGEARPIRQAA
jgi:DNA-binding MarR family transcriptional regulator